MSRNLSLPILSTPPPSSPPLRIADLLTELQSQGVRWLSPTGPGLSRSGGAGPSDHKAITVANHTVMVPIFTHGAANSPFSARVSPLGDTATLYRLTERLFDIQLPQTPRFYRRQTADGIPYWKIATLHGTDVLATTVLQKCIRYGDRQHSCQFCAIGQSLAANTTVARKTPQQLAEVAKAAVGLDGVRHAVLTTGTPATADRGAAVLAACSAAINAVVDIPIQAQCEPPEDYAWFERLQRAGVRTLGMHLEAVNPAVRQRIMPSKASISVDEYLDAFAAAVAVFGRAQVTTYILAGLGDRTEEILAMCERLVRMGVYPFVVPFVPIAGTPLAHRPAPSAEWMRHLLRQVAAILRTHGMASTDIAAGCGRCGACSSLRAREVDHD